MNTAIRNNRGGGAYNSAISAGGNTGTYASDTETWNGTAWTDVTGLSTARQNGIMRAASSGSGIYFGGAISTALSATEEWTAPVQTTVTFTAS